MEPPCKTEVPDKRQQVESRSELGDRASNVDVSNIEERSVKPQPLHYRLVFERNREAASLRDAK